MAKICSISCEHLSLRLTSLGHSLASLRVPSLEIHIPYVPQVRSQFVHLFFPVPWPSSYPEAVDPNITGLGHVCKSLHLIVLSVQKECHCLPFCGTAKGLRKLKSQPQPLLPTG